MPSQRSNLHGPAYPPARVFKPGMEFEWVGRQHTRYQQSPPDLEPRRAVLPDDLGRGRAAIERLGEGVVLTSRWLGDWEDRSSIERTGSWALVGGQKVVDALGRALTTNEPHKLRTATVHNQEIHHFTSVRDELGRHHIVRTADLVLDDERWLTTLRARQDEVRFQQLLAAREASIQRLTDVEEELADLQFRTGRAATCIDPAVLRAMAALAAHRIWAEGPTGFETGTFCACGESWPGVAFSDAAEHQAAALVRA